MNSIRPFIQELVELVSQMDIEPTSKADFNAQAWVQEWVNSPLPALGFKKPVELLHTVGGREQVKQLLNAIAHSAYM